jgi:hypothetical protein
VTPQNPPTFRRDVLPLHIEPIQRDAVAKLCADFERAYPTPYLLYTRSKLWDRSLLLLPADGAMGGGTQVVRYEMYEGGMSFLHPIRKIQTDPGYPGVVLGRAKNQDMVVPVPSISSAHVAFLPPLAAGGSWSVTDLGSKNGTWLNEEQLVLNEPRPIRDGQYLRLGGNLIGWFFEAGRLWELLRSPAELRKYTEV